MGDVLSAGGGMKASSVAGVRDFWKKHRELLPFLTKKALSLHADGKLYTACVGIPLVVVKHGHLRPMI